MFHVLFLRLATYARYICKLSPLRAKRLKFNVIKIFYQCSRVKQFANVFNLDFRSIRLVSAEITPSYLGEVVISWNRMVLLDLGSFLGYDFGFGRTLFSETISFFREHVPTASVLIVRRIKIIRFSVFEKWSSISFVGLCVAAKSSTASQK